MDMMRKVKRMAELERIDQRDVQRFRGKLADTLMRVTTGTGRTSQQDGMTELQFPRELNRFELDHYGIYKRFEDITIESIEKRGVPIVLRPQFDQVKRYISHIDEHMREGKGLILVGPVGTMKTTMAVAVLRHVIDNKQAGFFIPMVSLLDMINENERRQKYSRDLVAMPLEEKIRNTPLLVLDDLGAEYDHAWVQCKVDSIITERFNRMKTTIITTNLRRDEIKDRYQSRIFDRLRSSNIMVTFTGKSQRETARE